MLGDRWGQSPHSLISRGNGEGGSPSGPGFELRPRGGAVGKKAVGCFGFHLIWGPPGKASALSRKERKRKGKEGNPRHVDERPRLLGAAFTTTLSTNPSGSPRCGSVRSISPELACFRFEGTAARLQDAIEYFSRTCRADNTDPSSRRRAIDRSTESLPATAHSASTCRIFDSAKIGKWLSSNEAASAYRTAITMGLLTLRGRRLIMVVIDRQLPPVGGHVACHSRCSRG